MDISVLLTCFNRREKTVTCLQSLQKALDSYNDIHDDKIRIEIFLTDDGCTDGTAEAVRSVYPDTKVLHVLQGNGNLFWAGGMRYAWDAALKANTRWDYYLLINDDTVMLPCLFEDIMRTDEFCVRKYGMPGLYTGFIRDPETHKVSFGGSTNKLLQPGNEPKKCYLACANVMFFAQDVVDKIGTFDKRYVHAACDYDYSRMAILKGIPVLTTYSFVGECENEHRKGDVIDTSSMSFSERKKYMYKPTTGKTDYLLFVKKFTPRRYYASKFVFLMELYFPRMYKFMFRKRIAKEKAKHNHNGEN